jgi:hypothetical protein
MGQLIEEMTKAGALLATEGCLPSAIRQIAEAEDFGAEFTPELREQEARQRAQMAAQR